MHVAAVGLLLVMVPAQNASEGVEAPKPLTGWQALFQEHARDWQIAAASAAERPFAVIDHPLLFWSQPVRGGDTGAVYLWRDRAGRPAVIGTLFIWPHPSGSQGVAHELQSLASGPIRGRWRGEVNWVVSQAGLQWQGLDGVPPPSETPARRLLQMRSLAQSFAANSYDREDKLWKLRLLGKPLHRYETAESSEVLDGAVFAFVQGTDAEAFLLIEAIGRGRDSTWRFACAPMTDYRLEVRRGEQLVWQTGYRGVDTWNEPYVASTVEVRDSPDDME